MNDCIRRYDQKIEELGRKKYGHTTLLRQVKGVGPITSLAYVLTLEDPQRFVKSREVGPYLGLVPKQEDSGESQPQLGISKAGDPMVRRVAGGERAIYVGAFGPDTDLRRYGLRLCERGGKNAKKRAVVAVARKLAVLLHHLWVSGEVYEPLHQGLSPTIRRRWLRDGQASRTRNHAIRDGAIFAERRTQEQRCVDGAKTKSRSESLADNDIHRLVRVTAHKR